MSSQSTVTRIAWTPWVLAIAGFWLSSNLVLDFLVMPVMYLSGMATDAGFAPAGYSLFWSFNRVELVCAALLLSGVLALRKRPQEFGVCQSGSRCRWAVVLAVTLLGASLVDTYILTPEMGAMAFTLELAPKMPLAPVMTAMHGAYWFLDVLKIACLGGLGWLCFSDMQRLNDVTETTEAII